MEEPKIELVPEEDIRKLMEAGISREQAIEDLVNLARLTALGEIAIDEADLQLPDPVEPPKPRCFAYSPEGVRCELEPPHLGQDHTVAITWTDDESLAPGQMGRGRWAPLPPHDLPTPFTQLGTHETASGMLVERVAPTIPERPNFDEVECVACDANGHVGRLHKGENGACTVSDCYCERFVA